MAAEKREQNASRNNGGKQDSQEGAAAAVRGVATDAGHRVMEGMDYARDQVTHTFRKAEGMVARNPGPSLATSFGIGFGLGMLVALVLTQREETWAERNLPDSWRNLPDRLRNMNLPESVARHMPSR